MNSCLAARELTIFGRSSRAATFYNRRGIMKKSYKRILSVLLCATMVLNLTFVNYSGAYNSSSSNYYIAKLFEDSSKTKNDLGLYNQCFIK